MTTTSDTPTPRTSACAHCGCQIVGENYREEFEPDFCSEECADAHFKMIQDRLSGEETARLQSQLAAAEAVIAQMREALDSSRTMCREVLVPEYRFCGKTATKRVEWSDRSAPVCEEHIDAAKRHAANDGSGDRTDNPFISEELPVQVAESIDRLLALDSPYTALSSYVKQKQREVLEKAAAELDNWHPLEGMPGMMIRCMIAELDQQKEG